MRNTTGRQGILEEEASESETGLPWEDVETPPDWEELLVMCIDTSMSMGAPHHSSMPQWTRTHEVIRHIFNPRNPNDKNYVDDGLYHALEISHSRKSFWTAIIAFSTEARVIMEPLKLISPDGSTVYRPDVTTDSGLREILFSHGTGTAIGSALKLGYETALRWTEERGAIPRLATVAIISDGRAYLDPVNASQYAEEVKRQQRARAGKGRHQIQIATAAYGHNDPRQSDWDALEKMATTKGLFKVAGTGEELRNFLEASVTAGAK